jgi:hypothetical protein
MLGKVDVAHWRTVAIASVRDTNDSVGAVSEGALHVNVAHIHRSKCRHHEIGKQRTKKFVANEIARNTTRRITESRDVDLRPSSPSPVVWP